MSRHGELGAGADVGSEERVAKIPRLVDANIIGIVIWDFNGRIVEANDAFLRIVDYDREDLVSGRIRWAELMPPEWLDRDEPGWVPELRRTGSLQPFEREYFRKDRSRVPVLIGAATVEDGGTQGVAFVLDLTERKQAEEALREAQAEMAHMNRLTTMGQLTATIAHEVSQPIGATVNNANAALRWLGAQSPDLNRVREALRCIATDCNRAGEIIGRIRALVKKTPARKELVDINETISDAIALTRSEMLRHGVLLQTRLGTNLPPIRGDRVQLAQVLFNLLLNAIDAMEQVKGPRELLLVTEADGPDGILVSVRDSGPGLCTENRDRIFEPFYTTKRDGVGMGLSICRSIIEAHEGRMWASENVRHGALFQFTIPAHHKS